MTQTTDTPFDQWAIVEMLGHRRVAGRVREVQLAGAGFLRLDIPATPGHGEQTQFISPGSLYALHPVAEDVARTLAAQLRTPPVHRWELPAAPAAGDADSGIAIRESDDEEPDDDLPEWERALLDEEYQTRVAATGDAATRQVSGA